MPFNNIENIKEEFNLNTVDKDEIKGHLKKLLQEIHPDKNNGNFRNNRDSELFSKIMEALEYLDHPTEIQLTNSDIALTKIISGLIAANNTTSEVAKYEGELTRKIENSLKLYKSTHLFPKITTSAISILLTFIWLFPKTFSENPLLSNISLDFGHGKYLALEVWLVSVFFTIILWIFLKRREDREYELKTNLSIETTQNKIFSDFLKWKLTIDGNNNSIRFTKDQLVNYILNLVVQKNQVLYDETLQTKIDRRTRLPFYFLMNNMVVIDLDLAQKLADLIIARGQKKEVIQLEKARSFTDYYNVLIDKTFLE